MNKKTTPKPDESDGIEDFFNVIRFIFYLIIPIVIISYLTYQTRPRSGQLASCESNLKNIATALEMYSTDYKGKYPSSIKELTRLSYMKVLPSCPSCTKVYSYKVNSSYTHFTLWCPKAKSHVNAGVYNKGCWPQYNPVEGLKTQP